MVTRPRRQARPFQKRDLLEEILPWHQRLTRAEVFVPGENAQGWAKFEEDPKHFPGRPILKGSDIFQALSEISEIAVRSKPSLKKLSFLGFRIETLIRKNIPLKGVISLPVYATCTEKINNRHGKTKAFLYEDSDRKKVLAELIISFKLQ